MKVAKSELSIKIFLEIYRYNINWKTQSTYFLKYVRSCVATMLTNPELPRIILLPGLHSHPKESEQIKYGKN